jgi:hypothetical protein
VLVVTAGPAEGDVARLIEASGASHLVAEGGADALWRAGLKGSAPGWRLCLIAGAVPTGAWIDAVARHMATSDAPATLRVAEGWRARIAAAWLSLAGRALPVAGILVRDADITALRRLVRLPARIEDRRAAASGAR